MRNMIWVASAAMALSLVMGCSKSSPDAYSAGSSGTAGSTSGASGTAGASATAGTAGGAGTAGTAGTGAGGTGGGGAAGAAGTPADRGPTTIATPGQAANGLYWDPASATLFIADDANNQILTWKDGGDITLYATLPPGPPDGAGLGQLVKAADGTIYVTRFGYGSAGGVVFAKSDGTSGEIPGLDVERRRIGLTIASDGTLYDSYFVKSAGGQQQGAIARLGVDGSEPDVITGLQKPVGVLALGMSLYVSDQNTGEVEVAPIATPSSLGVFSMPPSVDLLTAGPAGSLFTGSTDGNVYQMDASGKVSTAFTGFQAVRGTAYDAVNHRIFIADHGGSAPSSTNFLQIRPVD